MEKYLIVELIVAAMWSIIGAYIMLELHDTVSGLLCFILSKLYILDSK